MIACLTPSFVFKSITQSPCCVLVAPPSPSRLFLKPYVCRLMQLDCGLSSVIEIISALGQVLCHNRHLWVESRSRGETLKTDLAKPTTISEKSDSWGAALESAKWFLLLFAEMKCLPWEAGSHSEWMQLFLFYTPSLNAKQQLVLFFTWDSCSQYLNTALGGIAGQGSASRIGITYKSKGFWILSRY